MKRLWMALLLLWLAGASGAARADGCTATLTDVDFGSVSPISSSDYFATGTGSIKCTWNLLSATPPYILLFPNVLVCVNGGLGTNSLTATPRTLGNGSGGLLPYNLFRNGTYTAAGIWGAPGQTGAVTPMTYTMTSPNILIGGNITQAFTVYGKITAGTSLAAVPTINNLDTPYDSQFAGSGTISYAFYNLFPPACTSGASSAFSFAVKAKAVNNCTITSTPLSFGTHGVLTSISRSTSTLSVQCVNNNAYQIALNGGTVAANVANRKMKNTVTNETVSYRLSASYDGALWGDGLAGTTLYSGTGNGAQQVLTLYGMLPVQGTPAPGDFKDTVTATIYF